MTISEEVAAVLGREEATFVVSVPCKLLDELIRLVEADADFTHVPATREEEGLGICAGAYLAGRFPVLLMQNSGLGNCINAIASLLNFYRIPVLMLITHRGTEGEKIGAQKPMGNITRRLLETVDVEYGELIKSEDVEKISTLIRKAKDIRKPTAALLPFSFWGAV